MSRIREESETYNHPTWMRLDNFAIMYPMSRGRNWASQYRMSMTLTEPVDPEVLQEAVLSTARRFPSFSVQVRKGIFWFYLKYLPGAPRVQYDSCCPCEPLRPEENDGFSFRVRYYNCRIAVEFFHALADGTGALSFTKTLVAEYLRLKYSADIPRAGDIMDCSDSPRPEEYEDSFKKYASNIRGPKEKERRAFRIRGRAEHDGFINVTCGMMPVDVVLGKAKEKNASLTQYLGAVMLLALADIQRREVGFISRRRPVKLCLPVNLRTLFPSVTSRNFASVVMPGIETRLGEYDLDEAIAAMRHQMGAKITKKNLQARFSAHVKYESNPIARIIPLFIKIPVLKPLFSLQGESRTTTTFTNLGIAKLPSEMSDYVSRIDIMLGPLRVNPVGCTLLSYKDKLCINITRKITSPKVERAFFTRLVQLGVPVKIDSNQRNYK